MSGLDVPIVARRLREAREAAGLSQKGLGIAAGIDEFSASARLNQYERGKHTPDMLTIKKLAAVLKAPVAYFYTEDDELAQILLSLSLVPKTKWDRVKQYLVSLTAER